MAGEMLDAADFARLHAGIRASGMTVEQACSGLRRMPPMSPEEREALEAWTARRDSLFIRIGESVVRMLANRFESAVDEVFSRQARKEHSK